MMIKKNEQWDGHVRANGAATLHNIIAYEK